MRNSVAELRDLFLRELNNLSRELEFIDEDNLWKNLPGVTNSCGVLIQHLAGNLQHFVGAGLGNTGYIRDRKKEFTNTGISKSELESQIQETVTVIKNVLPELSEEQLEQDYPMDLSYDFTTRQFLYHLYGHLNYHLGQVNYLRRILSEN